MGTGLAAVAAPEAPTGATLPRLAAAADRLASLAEALRSEQERRDELICLARDEGFSWRTIATAARCSMSRCVAIVGGGI